MTTGYIPIVVLTILAGVFAVLSLAASALVRPKRPLPAKSAPYECGIEPVRLPKSERFPVKFYVVAMLFIIFDIETIFLFPWAVAYRGLGLFGLVEMLVFIGMVFVAYLYIWHKGGLEWEAPERRSAWQLTSRDRLPAWLERGPGDRPGQFPEAGDEPGRQPVPASGSTQAARP
jgi:NADH-quinone oxidoreductase subunit A